MHPPACLCSRLPFGRKCLGTAPKVHAGRARELAWLRAAAPALCGELLRLAAAGVWEAGCGGEGRGGELREKAQHAAASAPCSLRGSRMPIVRPGGSHWVSLLRHARETESGRAVGRRACTDLACVPLALPCLACSSASASAFIPRLHTCRGSLPADTPPPPLCCPRAACCALLSPAPPPRAPCRAQHPGPVRHHHVRRDITHHVQERAQLAPRPGARVRGDSDCPRGQQGEAQQPRQREPRRRQPCWAPECSVCSGTGRGQPGADRRCGLGSVPRSPCPAFAVPSPSPPAVSLGPRTRCALRRVPCVLRRAPCALRLGRAQVDVKERKVKAKQITFHRKKNLQVGQAAHAAGAGLRRCARHALRRFGSCGCRAAFGTSRLRAPGQSPSLFRAFLHPPALPPRRSRLSTTTSLPSRTTTSKSPSSGWRASWWATPTSPLSSRPPWRRRRSRSTRRSSRSTRRSSRRCRLCRCPTRTRTCRRLALSPGGAHPAARRSSALCGARQEARGQQAAGQRRHLTRREGRAPLAIGRDVARGLKKERQHGRAALPAVCERQLCSSLWSHRSVRPCVGRLGMARCTCVIELAIRPSKYLFCRVRRS